MADIMRLSHRRLPVPIYNGPARVRIFLPSKFKLVMEVGGDTWPKRGYFSMEIALRDARYFSRILKRRNFHYQTTGVESRPFRVELLERTPDRGWRTMEQDGTHLVWTHESGNFKLPMITGDNDA